MARCVLSPRAAGKLRELLSGGFRQGGGGVQFAGAMNIDRFPAPFTVRWSATQGAWVIWLGDSGKLVSIGGDYATATDLDAADNLPAGWYVVSEDADIDSVYLDLDAAEPGAFTYSIGGEQSGGEEPETVRLTIADVAADETSGAKSVKQYITSALVFGVTSLNELVGAVEIVADDGGFELDGKSVVIKVDTDEESNTITLSLAEKGSGGEDTDPSTYCNAISDDGGNAGEPGNGENRPPSNDISNDITNDQSYDPCNNEGASNGYNP